MSLRGIVVNSRKSKKGDVDNWSYIVLMSSQGLSFCWPLNQLFILPLFSSPYLWFFLQGYVLLGQPSGIEHPIAIAFPKLEHPEKYWGGFCSKCSWVDEVAYMDLRVGLGIKAIGKCYSSIISGQHGWGSGEACTNLSEWLTITSGLAVWMNFQLSNNHPLPI